MAVRIIVDSASDLCKDYVEEHNLIFMPIRTIFGTEEYLDGITLSHQEFYKKLVEYDDMPTTSQLTPYDFDKVFREIDAAGDTAVVILLSGSLSGTYQNACIAAAEYPDIIFPFDSQSAAIGEQLQAKRAVDLMEEGKSAREILEILESERKQIRLLALLDTLEYLKKGGRISTTAAAIGGMLSIKPVITVVNGTITMLGKARGSKRGNNMLMEFVDKNGGIDFSRQFLLGYSGLNDSLLQKYIEDSRGLWEGYTENLPVSTIGCAIGTHTGPGTIAIAFYAKLV